MGLVNLLQNANKHRLILSAHAMHIFEINNSLPIWTAHLQQSNNIVQPVDN